MANSENLKPIRSASEAREKGKKGGEKSGEARRARKTLKEELLLLLENDNIQAKISLAIIKEALKGDIKAFVAIRDTIGEKPTDKKEITGLAPQIIVADEKHKEMMKNLQNAYSDESL